MLGRRTQECLSIFKRTIYIRQSMKCKEVRGQAHYGLIWVIILINRYNKFV